MFVQIGHLFLQLWGFDVGVWHSHHHHTPAQVIREIDALAHLSSDYREQQRSCETAAVHGTPLMKRKETWKHDHNIMYCQYLVMSADGYLDTVGELTEHLLDLVGFFWLLEDLRE